MSGFLVSRVFYIELSHPEQAVMIALAERGGDNGDRIFPSIAEVAWRTGYSERQVQRILRRLEEQKLIEPVEYVFGGRGNIPGYQMHLENGKLKPPCPRPGRNLDPKARPEKDDIAMSPIKQKKGDTAMSPITPQKGDIFDVKGDIFDVKGDIFDVKGDILITENATRAASHAESRAGTYRTNREPKENHTDAHTRETNINKDKQKPETAEEERPPSEPATHNAPLPSDTHARTAETPAPLPPAPAPLSLHQEFTAWLTHSEYSEIPGQRMTPVEKRQYEDRSYTRLSHRDVMTIFLASRQRQGVAV